MSSRFFSANAVDQVASVIIDGTIGIDPWDSTGESSKAFIAKLESLGDINSIELTLNSPGGSVADGLAIANYLRSHPARVVVDVIGQASSIASVIACAGDEVIMALGAFMFVHQAATVARGNARQLRAMADDLELIDTGILDCYVQRVGVRRREEMRNLVTGTDGEGTLLTARECRRLGIADRVDEGATAQADVAAVARLVPRPDARHSDAVATAADAVRATRAACTAAALRPDRIYGARAGRVHA